MPRPRLAPGQFGTFETNQVGDRWECRVRIRDAAGNLQRPKATGDTAEEAMAAVKVKAEAMWRGRFMPVSDLSTVAELSAAWLSSIDSAGGSERETSTREQYASNARNKIVDRIGAVQLTDLTVAYLNHFLDQLRSERSTAYATGARKILSMMLKYAVESNAIPFNPMHDVKQIRRRRGERTAKVNLAPDQVNIIIRLIREWEGRNPERLGGGRPDKNLLLDVVLIALGTSLRPSEILGLRPQDVRFVGDKVKLDVNGAVNYTNGDGLVRKDRTKHDGQERLMTVPSFTEWALRRRIAGYKPNRDEVLFTTRVNTTVSVTRLGKLFRDFREQHDELLRDIGVDPALLTAKAFRKTVATVIARKWGREAAASQLGHSDPTITDVYIEEETEVDAKLAELLDTTFKLDFLA